MKTKILDYNKQKAKAIFGLLKFSEIFGIFLFFFGFNWLGNVSYNSFWIKGMQGSFPITYFDFWLLGFATMLILILVTIALSALIVGFVGIINMWLKSNWRWAKVLAEDPESKIQRLKEKQKINKYKDIKEKEMQREKYGYCIGDIVKPKTNEENDYGNPELIKGKKYEIKDIDSTWVKITDERGDSSEWKHKVFNFTRNKIANKPKINMKFVELGADE